MSRLDARLAALLIEKKETILKKWFQAIVASYPCDTTRFLEKERDRFANPVGAIMTDEIEAIYDHLLAGPEPEKVYPFIDRIIRIRAVQDFTAAQAVSFFFELKRIIRTELKKEIADKGLYEELSLMDSLIDDVALLAFNIYVERREKIFDLKSKEMRNWTFRLLQKANLVYDLDKGSQDSEDGNPDGLI